MEVANRLLISAAIIGTCNQESKAEFGALPESNQQCVQAFVLPVVTDHQDAEVCRLNSQGSALGTATFGAGRGMECFSIHSVTINGHILAPKEVQHAAGGRRRDGVKLYELGRI